MVEEKRNELKQRKRNSGGRGITVYIPEFDEQAYNYCLLGATNETLAEFFGVCPATIKKWMKKYPSFGESVKRGKLMADMNVTRSLYKRAIGYTYQQVVSESVQVPATQAASEKVANPVATFLSDDMEDMRIIRVTTREAIPDVRAQIFWLKNRQPELWRDKQGIDHKSGGEKMGVVTIFELPNDGRNN
jgi:hypothetical protein